MAGLDSAIYVELDFTRVFMDGQIKPGHDKLSISRHANFFTCSYAGIKRAPPVSSELSLVSKKCLRAYAESFLRPRARLRESTTRPCFVDIRARKPCLRLRRKLLG